MKPRIKVKKLPHGYKLRPLREWENNEYFPIWGKVVADFKNGTWEAVDTDIGGNPEDKRKLKICVVDADANAYLDYFLMAHKVHKKSQDLLRNAGVNEGALVTGV
ncbi:hypothetical protein [Collimonas pratensis]|uniref:hypothetical protein n=1 Tax=Collimonas pratensis TaxID=279113 RepID=UPI000782FB1E|nr:hypothetical protein [Collimonas pratensis]